MLPHIGLQHSTRKTPGQQGPQKCGSGGSAARLAENVAGPLAFSSTTDSPARWAPGTAKGMKIFGAIPCMIGPPKGPTTGQDSPPPGSTTPLQKI
ncbi:hypothetical protein CENSYa_0772 [Cenarchaeum symbiosum A]|uniref:Uncharacterized protein n=1 Tax=Cenarchaeum symbiosum (strain A) TaxID=414004 RepID=A0RVN8_CENSY|nr:hypothetical protein CENSYa_0772 [Cenarchaeum symbiosum A]